jgi:hypothetical protein
MEKLYDVLNNQKKTPLNDRQKKNFLYIQGSEHPSEDDLILVKGQILLKALGFKLEEFTAEEKDLAVQKIVNVLKKKGLVPVAGIVSVDEAQFQKFDDPSGMTTYSVGSTCPPYIKLNYAQAFEKVRQVREYVSLRDIFDTEEKD